MPEWLEVLGGLVLIAIFCAGAWWIPGKAERHVDAAVDGHAFGPNPTLDDVTDVIVKMSGSQSDSEVRTCKDAARLILREYRESAEALDEEDD